MLWWRTL